MAKGTLVEYYTNLLKYNWKIITEAEWNYGDMSYEDALDCDAVRHIVNDHGPQGISDHSMEDIANIARLAYVIANFDDVTFEGNYSHKFKNADGTGAPHIVFTKKIDGTYYVVEAVCDNKHKLSHIVTAYIH